MAKQKDAKSEIRKILATIAEVSEKEIKDDVKFTEDLGIDSMKALEMVACIEKKLKLVIPEDKIPTIRTPKDIYTIVENLKK